MNIEERYADVIQQLNAHIASFNMALESGYRIRGISTSDLTTYSVVANRGWDDQVWPSKDYAGVYVFCGCDPSNRVAVYIGKASLKNIGHRIWSHLDRYRGDGVYKVGGIGSPYVLELILSVPMLAPTPRAMACALEEHIICGGLRDVTVVNTVGN